MLTDPVRGSAMDTRKTSYWTTAEPYWTTDEAGFPADTRSRTPSQPYRIPREYAAQQAPRPAARDYRPHYEAPQYEMPRYEAPHEMPRYEAPRGYPQVRVSGQVSRRGPRASLALLQPAERDPAERDPAERDPAGLDPAELARGHEKRPYQIRRSRTWPQRVGGVLLAGACVITAVWYVPRVMAEDRRLLTGTVTSSGVITLNFTYPGEISQVDVRLDQLVRKGEVLAAEYDPDAGSVVASDEATIASEQAKITELKAAAAADPAAAPADDAQIGAEKAQVAVDEAQLAADRMKIAAMEIVAPSAGIVIAANGQSGETVTASGIRDYATDSQQAATAQDPQFSLLPEAPQATYRIPASGSDLPVIALRTSTAWQVVTLIPEGSVSGIRPGQKVTVSVPAADIKDVPGQIDEVVPAPAATSAGVFYQAVVTITGHAKSLPMNGMTADIQLGS
jgi:multidrug resistance efflux pump